MEKCGKRIPYRYERCEMDAEHKGFCGPVGATLEDCRRLLRFALKVMAHGTDNQLIDARNFVEARLGGSAREPTVLIEHLWRDSK